MDTTNTNLPAGTEIEIALRTWTAPTGEQLHAAALEADGVEVACTDASTDRAAALSAALRLTNRRLWRLSTASRKWFS